MIESSFPDFYHKADAYSNLWQSRYLALERGQLALLLCASGVGALGGPALAIVALFSGALIVQMYRLVSRADEKWWNGRAGAESAKTVAWRFVAGGRPFELGAHGVEAELANRLLEISRDVARFTPIATSGAPVSDEMRVLRSEELERRVATYHAERVRAQTAWYAQRSSFNLRRATIWSVTGVVTSGLALALGVAAAVFDWPVDFVGFFSAAGASVAAWGGVRQHQTLARSYAVASSELGLVEAELVGRTTWTEADWASFVDEAEEAISREHVSWRAIHSS